jgi:hypothetical protein
MFVPRYSMMLSDSPPTIFECASMRAACFRGQGPCRSYTPLISQHIGENALPRELEPRVRTPGPLSTGPVVLGEEACDNRLLAKPGGGSMGIPHAALRDERKAADNELQLP